MIIKKIINRIVRSSGSPDKNDLWLDDNLNLKVHENEEWKTIAGGSGGGSGSASSLSDMTDVDISSPSDGDTLVYNATTHKWENGSGGGCSCLPPMIVEGTISEEGLFTPGSGAPTFTEAQTHMFSGGLLYLLLTNDGEPFAAIAATFVSDETISSFRGNDTSVSWEKYSSYFVNGTFAEELQAFIPDENEMSWSEAKDLFDYGNSVFLNSPDLTVMVSSYDPENIALVARNDPLDKTYYWSNSNSES